MVPQWIANLIGESRATALPVVVVYFTYRLTCRVLAPLTIASLVVVVGGKERSERALRLVELLKGPRKELDDAEGQDDAPV
ncbi:hypothetical protein GCM10010172_50500 [Paractinoplanes ferrugineus]|uniref:Uncharacterized protein n=1 Tax=Paractinoplanes ferrugineus TaxID=113564 RepID=A0A919JFQ2_9ACTN|nr:hypothetical protein [Actinoplanes ferrugineus]GIE16371.1 hypothetical protein Afe05nite_82110 [Actinoplanes ferrugineus]